MNHRIQNRTLVAMLVLFYVAMVSNTRAQEPQRKALRDSKSMGARTARSVMDKDLLDAYARIMEYQGAGLAIKETETSNKSVLKDRLTITVSDMRSGEPGELAQNMDRVMAERSEEALKIEREKMCRILESCDLAYHAAWVKGSGKAVKSPSLNGVDHYTVYTVTVSYQGKSRSHQGLMLYYRQLGKGPAYKIVDGLIPSINETTQDKLPQAKAPRSQYVESIRNGTTRNLRTKQETSGCECHVDGWSPATYGIAGMPIPVFVWTEDRWHWQVSNYPLDLPKWEWYTENVNELWADNTWVWHWDCPYPPCPAWAWGNTLIVAPQSVGTLLVSTTSSGLIKRCDKGGGSGSGSLTVYAKPEISGDSVVAVGSGPIPYSVVQSGSTPPTPYPSDPPGQYFWYLTNTTGGTTNVGSISYNGNACNFTPTAPGQANLNVTFYPFVGTFTTASKPVTVVPRVKLETIAFTGDGLDGYPMRDHYRDINGNNQQDSGEAAEENEISVGPEWVGDDVNPGQPIWLNVGPDEDNAPQRNKHALVAKNTLFHVNAAFKIENDSGLGAGDVKAWATCNNNNLTLGTEQNPVILQMEGGKWKGTFQITTAPTAIGVLDFTWTWNVKIQNQVTYNNNTSMHAVFVSKALPNPIYKIYDWVARWAVQWAPANPANDEAILDEFIKRTNLESTGFQYIYPNDTHDYSLFGLLKNQRGSCGNWDALFGTLALVHNITVVSKNPKLFNNSTCPFGKRILKA
jgi:hypothetical protein